MHDRRQLFDFMIERVQDVGGQSGLPEPQAFARWFSGMYFQKPQDFSIPDGSGDGKVDAFFTTKTEDDVVLHHVINSKFTKTYNQASPVQFYDEITRFWQAFENKGARKGYLRDVVRPELRPRYTKLFERYDAGFTKLLFLTNHRRNENQYRTVSKLPLEIFHLEDLLQFMVDHIEEAMPRTSSMLLTGVTAVLSPDRRDTEVPTSIVFARLSDFIGYMRNDPYGLLFARNVRLSLGRTEVNKEIERTFSEAPKEFVFSNNGITMLCEKHRHDPGSHELLIENPRVVNGAQTLHSIRDAEEPSPHARIMVRIIEIPPLNTSEIAAHAEKRKDIIHKISTRTNRQNPIKKWNLVSNDEFQNEMARYFRDRKLFYERRAKEWAYRRTELTSVGISKGPTITYLTQLMSSFYWDRRHLGPVAAKELQDLFEEPAYGILTQTSPETAYQIYLLSEILGECLWALSKEKKYIKQLQRHVGFVLFSLVSRALKEAGATWGKSNVSVALEDQQERIRKRESVATRRWRSLVQAGVRHVRAFYRREALVYRRAKGKPLTFVNYFKSHGSIGKIFGAPIPRSLRAAAKGLLAKD